MNRLGVCDRWADGAVATTMMAGVGAHEAWGSRRRLGWSRTRPQLRARASASRRSRASSSAAGTSGATTSIDGRASSTRSCRRAPPQAGQGGARARSSPWPAVVSPKRFLEQLTRQERRRGAAASASEIALLEKNVKDFKAKHKLERVVMVNLTSTEKYCEVEDVHRTLAAFEAGLDTSDQRISPAMKFLYVACKLGFPHVNFTPSLTKIPALEQLAEQTGAPDRRRGRQDRPDVLKTVLAPAFRVAPAPGGRLVLDQHPGQQRRQGAQRPRAQQDQGHEQAGVLDEILGYPVEDHQVHIHYYTPARRREGGLGQHRSRRLPRRADADEGQLPLQGLHPRRAARARSGAPGRRRQARGRARHPAPALAVLQGALPHRGREAGPRLLQAERRARSNGSRRSRRCSARRTVTRTASRARTAPRSRSVDPIAASSG